MLLKPLRHTIVQSLWEIYRAYTPQMQLIESALRRKGVDKLILDHFAIIDLPSTHSGIAHLSQIFALLGYEERGRDYLPSKQNDFVWMAEAQSPQMPAAEVLPQVVVADFRWEALPANIKMIIEKYTKQSKPFPHDKAKQLLDKTLRGEEEAGYTLKTLIVSYLSTKDWPAPTLSEYKTVQAFNELLAWVLIFGRQPNHFTLSLHLLNQFASFEDFQSFVEKEMKLPLNTQGGKIKGGVEMGIKQGSTHGVSTRLCLTDGEIDIPTGFVEFVWRYPLKGSASLWGDFYTGFIAQQANHVIESLYVQ